MKQIAGIYCITINGKRYIGSSVNMKTRLIQHKSDLKGNRHGNPYLQNAYNLYKDFKGEILEVMSTASGEELVKREKEFVLLLNAEYNINDPITNFNTKKVYQFDLKENLVCEFDNVTVASNVTGIGISNIQHAAQINEKVTKTAGGFLWSYENSPKDYIDNRHTPIHVYDISGKYLMSYPTIKIMCSELLPERRFAESMINRICRNKSASIKGFRFSYEKKDQLDNTLLLTIGKNYPIVQLSFDKSEEVKVWENIKSAAKELNCKKMGITDAIIKNHRYKGFYWKRLGILKQGELLETPEKDNQQPSLSSNALEGSTTNSRVQTGNAEDSNGDTSALPGIGNTTFKLLLKKEWFIGGDYFTGDDIV